MQRRGFLAGLAALTLPPPSWAEAGSPAFLAAGKRGEAFVLHGLSAAGESVFDIALPGRGHAAAAHPQQPFAVAFARRPGVFALVIDCRSGQIAHRLSPPDGRQFNGHGVFSADGAILYTSEVIAETSEGRIGLWDGVQFTRLGEWASGGIGPHDIRLRGDGTLIVANGGIATDPTDRSKLNLATMRPNLAQISAQGNILAQAELMPELAQNSIRHLAIGRDGRVAFAMQWEGEPTEPVPLLGLWQPGQAPELCPARQDEAFLMRGYAGSIAMTGGGKIAITSPRGGVVMIHAMDGSPIATHHRTDICGVAARGDGFVLSDGTGRLWSCDEAALRPLRKDGPAWDNHLVTLTT